MEGERELTTGLLSTGANFRLIVSGRVGKTELERLIRKLELDKEILADDESPKSRTAIDTAATGEGVTNRIEAVRRAVDHPSD